MQDRYILTIHIAEGGTPYFPLDGSPASTSSAGHMWYSIQKASDSEGEQSYGFQSKNGVPFGAGKVSKDDNDTYCEPRYARTIEITKEQYERLRDFGENGYREKWDYFKSNYNVLTNSCVDFTWAALRHAGFTWHRPAIVFPDPNGFGFVHTIPEYRGPIGTGYGGKLVPRSNWREIQKIIAPIPNSDLNSNHEGKTRSLKEASAELFAETQRAVPISNTSPPVPLPQTGEPLKKNPAYASRYATNTAPANTINRLLVAHTLLKDALWAVSLTGREALSSLYQFTVRFKSDSPDLDCQEMIGKLCAVELETDQNGKRWLSGQMVDFAATGQEGRHWLYKATVAPKLWHASRRADFRIWQNQTVPAILDQVLSENAVRFDVRFKANYKTWPYLVQYRETDLNFILRQLEHEGIFFWFEHAEDGETLVLADHFTCHPDCPGYASVPYYSGANARPEHDHFDGWRMTRRVETGCLIHSDYDFERPSSDLTTEYADPRGHLFDHYERFHYPGDYTDTGDGNQYAANTLERLQREQETIHLSGRVRGAAPGHRLTLTEHPRADQNRELTLVSVTYDIADNDYEATNESHTSHFRIEVQAIPAERPFRPPLVTSKPRSRGVETAVVVGATNNDSRCRIPSTLTGSLHV